MFRETADCFKIFKLYPLSIMPVYVLFVLIPLPNGVMGGSVKVIPTSLTIKMFPTLNNRFPK